MSHGHRSGDFDDDPDLLKKVITSDESWVYDNWGYERNIEPGAVGDTKKHASEVEKTLTYVYYISKGGGLLGRGQDSFW